MGGRGKPGLFYNMANTTARFDPSIVIDAQLRVARDGSIIFEFYDEAGDAVDMYETQWEFLLKKQAGSPNVLRLTTGLGDITVIGDSDEQVKIAIDATESNIPTGSYYYEIYRPDLKKTWFTGTCFVSNGIFTTQINQAYITISTNQQIVRVTLNESVEPISVVLRENAIILQINGTRFGSFNAINFKNGSGTTPVGTADDVTGDIKINIGGTITDNVLVKGGVSGGTLYGIELGNGSDFAEALASFGVAIKAGGTLLIGINSNTTFMSMANAAAALQTSGTLTLIGDSIDQRATANALVDAASMALTKSKHTLATSSPTRTFTITFSGDDITLEVTLSATSSTFTFPATALCVSEGVASGDNTCALSGVSGDKYIIAIKKIGSAYYVVCKNFGQ